MKYRQVSVKSAELFRGYAPIPGIRRRYSGRRGHELSDNLKCVTYVSGICLSFHPSQIIKVRHRVLPSFPNCTGRFASEPAKHRRARCNHEYVGSPRRLSRLEFVPSPVAEMKDHTQISVKLVAETLIIYSLLLLATSILASFDDHWLNALAVLFSITLGLWLERLFVLAHECVHKKLLPDNPLVNDFIGWLVLLPVGAPLSIYRKIHYFHHGFNRKDHSTAALDTFIAGTRNETITLVFKCIWIYYVFFGGFFVHSVITVLLFLFAPGMLLLGISDVFKAWTMKMRLLAWVQTASCVAFHAVLVEILGLHVWCLAALLPLAVFAWLWSLKLYIYHYRQPIGLDVRRNVRSLKPNRFLGWLLLNFNEHSAHHFDPTLPWYKLPGAGHSPCENVQERMSVIQAILQQAAGPTIVSRK